MHACHLLLAIEVGTIECLEECLGSEEVRHGRRSACAHAYFTGNANTSGPSRAGSGR